MIQLEVLKNAVSRLRERIDEIVFKGWDKDPGMSYLSINEIKDTVRLIDMGFYPLYKEMAKEVGAINIHSDALFDTVINGMSEQSSDEATKPDMNSVEGWNYFTMENNIKTFINEFGREPESFEEVLTYITETVAKVVDKNGENKKADAPTSTNKA
ncbi:hypothetical protein ACFTQ7_16760 [Lysinibacillus sp. NPDC056959]|uniref:hypothetical protein n=1 Tax=Lysinibacillus sp. NPDC056959 TaxID=3345981 RepID=UPI003643E1D4